MDFHILIYGIIAIIVYHWYEKYLWACVVSLHLEVVFGQVHDGIFQWWITPEITDDKECAPLKWQALAVTHSHPLSDNNNGAASGELRGCTVGQCPVLKECFRWVKPFQFSSDQRAKCWSLFVTFGCLGLVARMDAALLIFQLVILSGKSLFKTVFFCARGLS